LILTEMEKAERGADLGGKGEALLCCW